MHLLDRPILRDFFWYLVLPARLGAWYRQNVYTKDLPTAVSRAQASWRYRALRGLWISATRVGQWASIRMMRLANAAHTQDLPKKSL